MSRLVFLSIVVIPGGVLMALEIVSSRVLAPQFGNSVYVWGSIIGVFLAAMSIGYVWGGQLADRAPRLPVLGRLILLAGVAQALIIAVGARVVDAIGTWTGGAPAGTLLAASFLFGPVTVLLATVSPYAVRLAARGVDQLGNTAGRLYALSTAGSLLGTIGATFGLIPYLGLRTIQAVLLVITVLVGVAGLSSAWRRERGSLVLAALLLVYAVLGPQWRRDTGYEVLAERMTPYQTLEVIEAGDLRQLRSDGVLHGAVEVSTGAPPINHYVRQATVALLFQPEVRRVLVLGLGSGGVSRVLRDAVPGVEVDLVDIDPAVHDVARAHMLFEEGPGVRVHIDDGRRFLRDDGPSWDLIYLDTYIGNAVPFHLTTEEFLTEAKARLAPGGVVALNLAGSPRHPFARALLRTLQQSFRQLHLFQAPGVHHPVVIATDAETRLTAEALVARGEAFDRTRTIEPALATLAAARLDLDLDLSDAPRLTDAFAPVNHLITLDGDTQQNEDLRFAPVAADPPRTDP